MNELTKGTSNTERQLTWLAAAGLSAAAFFAVKKLSERVHRPAVDLRGKVAIVTGGSRGLGLAIANELAELGARLALVARDKAELEAAAARLRASGVDVAVFPVDIARPENIPVLISDVLAHFGAIDILVNDAGLIKVAPLENLTHTDFEEAMNLMFWAPVNLTLAVLPHMQQSGGGHIVNITSVGGRVSIPHLLPYCCAKFGLVGFSTGLASELDLEKVHVLTVVPGLMRTGSYLHATFKGAAEQEFAWFSLLANLPGVSIAVEDAAREIRQSLLRREATCTISFPAKVLIQSEALLPEATRNLMQQANRFILPGPGGKGAATGRAINPRFGALFQTLTSLGRMAARSYNQ